MVVESHCQAEVIERAWWSRKVGESLRLTGACFSSSAWLDLDGEQ